MATRNGLRQAPSILDDQEFPTQVRLTRRGVFKKAAMLAIALVHVICLAAFVGLAARAPVIEDLE